MRVTRGEWTEDCAALHASEWSKDSTDEVPYEQQDCWLVEDGPLLAAFATGRQSYVDPTYYFLSRAAVAVPYRGQGLQKRLIQARVRHARRQGYLWVWSYTVPTNAPSMRSLLSCGFKPFDERPFRQEDYVALRKRLAP